MSQTTSVPIGLFGVDPATGEQVAKQLKPEIEVVHFSTKPHAKEAIIALLSKTPKTPPEAGTHTAVATFDYSKQVQALIFGGGFKPEVIKELQDAIAGETGLRSVPWLGGEPMKVQKALKEFDGKLVNYGVQASQRVKAVMQELQDQGKLGDDDGLYFY